MSYGATVAGAIHEAGIYAGKILSGAKVDHSTTAAPRTPIAVTYRITQPPRSSCDVKQGRQALAVEAQWKQTDCRARSRVTRLTHLRHQRAFFAVMQSGVLPQGCANVRPQVLRRGRP